MRIALLMRSRWLPGCMPASMLSSRGPGWRRPSSPAKHYGRYSSGGPNADYERPAIDDRRVYQGAKYPVLHVANSVHAVFSPAHVARETFAWRREATGGTGELVFGSGVICAGYRCSSCGGSEPTLTPPSAFSIASATPA